MSRLPNRRTALQRVISQQKESNRREIRTRKPAPIRASTALASWSAEALQAQRQAG